ncbi:MAG: hypothetical protein ABI790_14385 [Betaproteobacteria bacterium]
MRTLIIIVLGLVLLALWIGVARALAGGDDLQVVKAIRAFVGLWFLAAAGNMAVGVLKAGYGVLDELPIFLLIFGVPAAAAYFIVWKSSKPPLEEP